MRLWTLHPRYLDAQGLVAAWREALLAQKVLEGATRGYTRHPQLIRFQSHPKPLEAIKSRRKGSATVSVASVGVPPTDSSEPTWLCKMFGKSVWRDARHGGRDARAPPFKFSERVDHRISLIAPNVQKCEDKAMKVLILFVGWCILFVLCWPVAILAVVLFPIV